VGTVVGGIIGAGLGAGLSWYLGGKLFNESSDYDSAQPSEKDLGKIKERDGNKAAQDAGYIDAHDAKKGRGEGGVDIYRDKTTGKTWLWNGVPGGDKEAL
jgi:hypothetical protein